MTRQANPETPRTGAPAIVPDAFPAEIVAIRGDHRESLGPEKREQCPSALEAALQGGSVRWPESAAGTSIEKKLDSMIHDAVGALEITYGTPVRLAVALDHVPSGTSVDSSGRAVITFQRLVIHETAFRRKWAPTLIR